MTAVHTAASAAAPGRRHVRLALLGLVAVTASWGSTFPMLKDVVTRVPVADFLAVRFLVAFLALAAVAGRSALRLSPRERLHGVALGIVYGLAQLVQTTGLQHTAASVSGFLTGLYVVLTPLLGALLLRQRLGRAVWFAVALSTGGLALLSLDGLAIGGGEALTVASAVLYALHIVGLGRWSTARSALGLSVVQMGTIAVVCGLGAVPDGVVLPSGAADWAVLLYMALIAGALALVVQTWAQAHLTATRAAIVMTLEPVWAAGFAVALGGERLGPRGVLGGALVLGAMYVVELSPSAPDVAEEIGGVAHVGPV